MRFRSIATVLLVFGATETVRASSEPTPPRVDLARVQVRGDGATAPVAGGQQARLTIDVGLQRTSRRLLLRARPIAGAVVAADYRTGRVLVWADHRRSKTGGGPSPLLRTDAPAASVFKIVTTAALLQRGHVQPSRTVCFRGGSHEILRRHLEPPSQGRATCAPFFEALGHSRNAVYAQLATQHLNRADLELIAEQVGFNGNVPFDVPLGVGRLAVPYNDLDFARAAAGFSESTLSPLGGLHVAFTVATGGRPAMLRIVESAPGYQAPVGRKLLPRVLDSRTARNLRRMMEVTVHSGTSLDAFTDEHGNSLLPGIRVAGKTGTLKGSPTAPTTTWFVGFAPSRKPRIVVSVLVQNAPVWRRKANEVARDVLRAYFADRNFRRIRHPLRK